MRSQLLKAFAVLKFSIYRVLTSPVHVSITQITPGGFGNEWAKKRPNCPIASALSTPP
jgi:hypothetical protein